MLTAMTGSRDRLDALTTSEATGILRLMRRELIDARKRLGLSQEELAETLGVDRARISKWECEVSIPGIVMLIRWAYAVGLWVTVDQSDRGLEWTDKSAGGWIA